MTSERGSRLFIMLFVVALVADLLTPFLIWKHILPAPVRWISHAALLTLLVAVFVHMLIRDRVPGAVWIMVGIGAIGATVAVLGGQGLTATGWGLWVLFGYPLVGLFAYLQPWWPDRFPQRFRTAMVAILAVEVLVQIGQYVTGELPGDNLAGTFGRSGTANLVMFIMLVLCVALGRWFAHGQWKTLVLVLALGAGSSVLGEMKLFPFAALAVALAAVFLLFLQGEGRWRVVPYVILVGLGLLGFVSVYNSVVVAERGTSAFESYLQVETLEEYLGGSRTGYVGGVYEAGFGRNYGLAYGWNSIRNDPVTLLFGWGIGARGESRTLDTAGIGLQEGSLGLSTGTSLLVMMQELGIMGLIAIGAFILWTAVTLYRDIKRDPDSEATELRYALLLFSLLWPLWLWYGKIWIMRVPMLLYWVALGYVLGEAWRQRQATEQVGASRWSLQGLRASSDGS